MLSFLNVIRFPITLLPNALQTIVEASVAAKRIGRYLARPDLVPRPQLPYPGQPDTTLLSPSFSSSSSSSSSSPSPSPPPPSSRKLGDHDPAVELAGLSPRRDATDSLPLVPLSVPAISINNASFSWKGSPFTKGKDQGSSDDTKSGDDTDNVNIKDKVMGKGEGGNKMGSKEGEGDESKKGSDKQSRAYVNLDEDQTENQAEGEGGDKDNSPILQDININIKPGSLVAVVGMYIYTLFLLNSLSYYLYTHVHPHTETPTHSSYAF